MRRNLSSVLLVMLVAGCSGTVNGGAVKDSAPASKAANFSSASDVKTALDSAGLTCNGLKSIAVKDREWGTESAVDVGRCDIEGEKTEIDVFKDNGQRENWEGMQKQVGCMAGKAFGISSFDYVNGGLWTISPRTQTLANKIADALGGQAVHVKCES